MSEVRWRAGKTHTSRRRAKPCSNQGDGYNSRTVKGDRASTNLTFMKGRQKAGSGAWGWVTERSGTTHRLRLGLFGMLERLADRIGTDQPIAAALVPPTVAALLHKPPRLQRTSSQLHWQLPREPFQKNLVPINQCCQHPHACCGPPSERVGEREDRRHASLLRIRRTGQSSDEAKTIQATKSSR